MTEQEIKLKLTIEISNDLYENNITEFKKLLDKKAEENNKIDLDAYAFGLEAMYEAINYTRCCDELCDETENNRKNSSIATYTKNSKHEHYA